MFHLLLEKDNIALYPVSQDTRVGVCHVLLYWWMKRKQSDQTIVPALPTWIWNPNPETFSPLHEDNRKQTQCVCLEAQVEVVFQGTICCRVCPQLQQGNNSLHLSSPDSSPLLSLICFVFRKVPSKREKPTCVCPPPLRQLPPRPHIYIVWWPAHQPVPSCGDPWSPTASLGWHCTNYLCDIAGGAMLAPDSFWTYRGRMWMTSGKDFTRLCLDCQNNLWWKKIA